MKEIAASNQGNFFTRWFKSEVASPEKLFGNINIAFNTAVFGAAILVFRKWGYLFAV
ncbi:hypothetical protein BKA69DRAFT_1083452 [Paraphysoderma sedebokerense]|nr:hypothetical protein BKA69DRAFT_1083452 [Paraphysoderma sedebokerense]